MAHADNKGVQIFWRTAGNGEPLLMIMGLGYASDMWHHMEELLSRKFRLILFDNRGIGKSGPVPGPHLIADLASDAAAVLEAAGIESAHVFGLSLGSFIAQEFALQYPEKTRSLILGCTACGGRHVVPAEPKVLETLVARREMEPEEAVRAMIPYIYDPATAPERIEADMDIRLRTYPSAQTYEAQLEGAGLWSSYDRLPEIHCPTLVIHGAHDQLIPPENGRIVANRIPGAILREIQHASHIFITDQPQASARLVADFLTDSQS